MPTMRPHQERPDEFDALSPDWLPEVEHAA